jgi:uncharacterized protein (DUF1919 family)
MYSFVGNNCFIEHVYKKYDKKYDYPFIFTHIHVDDQYLKLCENYEYYVNVVPTFYMSGTHLVALFDDVEVLCYHYPDRKAFLDKFSRRKERQLGTTPVFFWGDMYLYQTHTKEELENIKKRFNSLPNSVYLESGVELKDINFNCETEIGVIRYSELDTNIPSLFVEEFGKIVERNLKDS